MINLFVCLFAWFFGCFAWFLVYGSVLVTQTDVYGVGILNHCQPKTHQSATFVQSRVVHGAYCQCSSLYILCVTLKTAG